MDAKRVSPRALGMLLCLLVILSLIAAEFTWIVQPAHAEGDSWPWRPYRARISARIIGHRLHLTGAGFAIRHTLNVRVRRNDGENWFYLDSLKAGRRGRFTADLPLPHHLENANTLRVCVKDTSNSRLACVIAHRY